MLSCAKKEEPIPESQTTTTTTSTVTVSRVDLGRELAADRRVITWNNTFKPADTVYAAVSLTAPQPTQVTARWISADGQVVTESTQMVSPSEVETVTQFNLAPPAGLPPGTYSFVIRADGQVVNTKEFIIAGP